MFYTFIFQIINKKFIKSYLEIRFCIGFLRYLVSPTGTSTVLVALRVYAFSIVSCKSDGKLYHDSLSGR